MSAVLFCNQSLDADDFQSQCGFSMDQVVTLSCAKPKLIRANTPYLLDNGSLKPGYKTFSQLSALPVAKELTNHSLSYGGDNITAIAEITAKLKEYNIGLVGSSTTVYTNRIDSFLSSVKNYQASLMEYRKAIISQSQNKAMMKQRAFASHQKMQAAFQYEIQAVTHKQKISGRGTPLTSPVRATNIARSSRNVAKLEIVSQFQVNELVKFTKYAHHLGNGLALVDFGSRIGNMRTSYKSGGQWERELFIESSSFAASASAGVITAKAGALA